MRVYAPIPGPKVVDLFNYIACESAILARWPKFIAAPTKRRDGQSRKVSRQATVSGVLIEWPLMEMICGREADSTWSGAGIVCACAGSSGERKSAVC